MPLSDKDRRALLWGGPVAAVLILYLLTRGEGSGPRPEPLPADAPATVETASPPMVAVVAVPDRVASAPVAAAQSAGASQLRLVGILSSGALIAMADGSQRFVPVGREIVPGVILRGVGVHQAILATPSGELRLPLDAGAPTTAPAVTVAPAAPPGMPPRP